MHAIAHKVLEDRPDARVLYVSAEHFTNEFIEALQHHKMDEFRARYRSECDLLLLDDIQFLAGREQTQEEFFHTFNALRDADKPIVVTSDKYPQQLQRMPERLVSRFTSGLVADIQVPQLETRVAIIRKKANIEGISINDDVAVLLAQSVQSNVRELEGALIRLAAKSSLTGRPIDSEFARSEIAMVAPRRPEMMSVEDIQKRRVRSLPAVELGASEQGPPQERGLRAAGGDVPVPPAPQVQLPRARARVRQPRSHDRDERGAARRAAPAERPAGQRPPRSHRAASGLFGRLES